MAGFADFMQQLQAADFFTGVLPFVVTYAIFYVTLINAPKFKESQKITTLVAASFGFLASFFVLQSPFYQTFFIDYLGFLSVGLLGIVGLISVLMLSGFKEYFEDISPGDGNALVYTVGGIAAVVVLAAFVTAGGFGPAAPQQATTAMAKFTAFIGYMFNTGLIWAVAIVVVLAIGLTSDMGNGEGNGDDSESELRGG